MLPVWKTRAQRDIINVRLTPDDGKYKDDKSRMPTFLNTMIPRKSKRGKNRKGSNRKIGFKCSFAHLGGLYNTQPQKVAAT